MAETKPFNQRVYSDYVRPFVDRYVTPAIDTVGYYVPPGTRQQIGSVAQMFATPDTYTPTRNALTAYDQGRYGLAATEGINALLAPLMVTPLAPELLAARGMQGAPAIREGVNKLLRREPPSPPPQPPGLTAYHGSPHDFDAFDMSKIGTGEGAQAYGHGLYFAENEGVAKTYKGAEATLQGPKWKAQLYLDRANGDTAKAISDLRREAEIVSPGNVWSDHSVAAKLLENGWSKPVGRLYEVRIHADPADFLDWDKPRDALSPKLREWAKTHHPDVWDKAADGASFYQHLQKKLTPPLPADPPGVPKGWGYVQRGDEGQPTATRLLREAGIPGIRYLDQGSRTAGVGTANFVVFDDGIVQIVSKDGQLVQRPSPQQYTGQPLRSAPPSAPTLPGVGVNALAAGVSPYGGQ